MTYLYSILGSTGVYILALALSAIAGMVIGALWYSPRLFGTHWFKETGIDMNGAKPTRKEMIFSYGGHFITLLVTIFGLAVMLGSFLPVRMIDSIKIGLFVWLFFMATTSIQSVFWEKKSWKLFFISTGYQLVTVVAISAILFGMLMQ